MFADFGIHIDFAIETKGWQNSLPHYDRLTREAVLAALQEISNDGREIPAAAELSVLLTDDAGIAALNSRWRGKEGPTNILSFPALSPTSPRLEVQFLGDLALSIETLHKEAMTAKILLKNHYCHLIVHGMLHLFAYDHIDAIEAEHMERLEVEALARLGITNPYS